MKFFISLYKSPIRTLSAILGAIIFSLILLSASSAEASWTDSGDNVFITGGNVGVGTSTPSRSLDVYGGAIITDSISDMILLRTMIRNTAGYAGGTAHYMRVLTLLSPYEQADGTTRVAGIVLGSPEIFGQENAYLYSFGSKNIRIGTINDGWRRSEIELYNDNTFAGEILFRTGLWQDPGNIPGTDTKVRMKIDKYGQVGIGTTQPAQLLDVNGNMGIAGDIIPTGDLCIGVCGGETLQMMGGEMRTMESSESFIEKEDFDVDWEEDDLVNEAKETSPNDKTSSNNKGNKK